MNKEVEEKVQDYLTMENEELARKNQDLVNINRRLREDNQNFNLLKGNREIIYKYSPRTFEEEQHNARYVSDIFESMFSQRSPWLGSIRNYTQRKQFPINKYFVNQL